ncbi:MAG: hypothetical protein RR277_01010 [Rikenellaceae bacterium]
MLELKDLFLYFARFVPKNAVADIFNTSSSSMPGYTDLLQSCENIDHSHALPSVNHYVFGIDQTSVTARIASFSGYYLFIDYGGESLFLDKIGSTNKSLSVAATVACPIASLSSLDQAEIMLLSDNARALANSIYRQVTIDSIKDYYWLRNINKFEISPFVAPDLSSSYGYTLNFDVNYK